MGGTKLGRFEVERELASSPAGSVYKAQDPKTGRVLALRTVPLDLSGGAKTEMRLLHGAKAASVLNSPNIASIYGGGRDASIFFVAVEYVGGKSLCDMLAERQRFSPSAVIDLSRQVCSGLDHAHHHGVFHSNLHPGNILIEMDGTAKILDFGIPKDIASVTQDRICYFPPEQRKGAEPDARANLFSWGVILYELVTGQKAFATAEAVPAPPHEANAAVPVAISNAIMKAIAADPAERYQSGKELVEALEYRAAEQPAPMAQFTAPEIVTPPIPVAESAPRVTVDDGTGGTVYSPPPPPPSVPPSKARQNIAKARTEVKRAVRGATDKLSRPETDVTLKNSLRYAVPAMIVLTLVLVGLATYYFVDGKIAAARAQAPATTAAPVQTPAPEPAPAATPTPDPLATLIPVPEPASTEPAAPPAPRRRKAATPSAKPSAPMITTGEVAISSVPEGALVQIDGRTSATWQTPLVVTLSPGSHELALTKAGYAPYSQAVTVEAAKRATFAASLTELGATVVVTSEPAGAAVLVDGRNTGHVTPAQLVVPKGNHSFVLRKAGYFDFGSEAQLAPGQSMKVTAPLKMMGDVGEIRTPGRFGKLLGRNAKDMASVQIRTNPKGAQIVINNKIMDKSTPAEFLLPAGHYEIVLMVGGYEPLRKMISVDTGSKLVIDEALQK